MANIIDLRISSAKTATTFFDKVGVNIHSATGGGAYLNSELIVSSLKYIGVNNAREHFTEFGIKNAVSAAVASAGVKFNFVVGSDIPAQGDAAVRNYVQAIGAFSQAHGGAVAGIEGLNEGNIQPFNWHGDSSMIGARNFQIALYNEVRSVAALSGAVVVAPSVAYESAAAYSALGDLRAWADVGNAHAYTSLELVADTTMETSMANAAGAVRGKGVYITETGFTTARYTPYLGASEEAQATLTLQSILNSYENGAGMTYLYELFNSRLDPNQPASEHNFGLFNADGTPKLAATALHNLSTILEHEDAGSPVGLGESLSITRAPSDLHTTVLAKANNVADILVWRDVNGWDYAAKQNATVPPQQVTIQLGAVHEKVYVYDPVGGLAPIAVFTNVREITLDVTNRPLVVELGAQGPVTEPVWHAPAVLEMTAADFVAQIGELADAVGLQRIKLTDTNTLTIATMETMRHLATNFNGVLAKVDGDVVMNVVEKGSYWKLEQLFSERGDYLGKVDTTYVNGQINGYNKTFADGSTEWARFQNGVIQQTSVVEADGDKVDAVYQDGALLRKVELFAAGGSAMHFYDIASGQVTSEVFARANGTSRNIMYNVGGTEFANLVREYNADGSIQSIAQVRANGTLNNLITYRFDGSYTLSTFDALGVLRNTVLVGGTNPANQDILTVDLLFTPRTEMLLDSAGQVNGAKVTEVTASGYRTTTSVGGLVTSVAHFIQDNSRHVTQVGGTAADAFFYYGRMTNEDKVVGGAGDDLVALQGDYSAGLTLGAQALSGVETIALVSGSDTRFGDAANNRYTYNLTMADGNVGHGERLIVNGANLLAGEHFLLNGAAERDGTLFVYAGRGGDQFIGGQDDDVFFFAEGRYASSDRIDGGGGDDIMVLRGDYSGANAVVLAPNAITGVETIAVLSATDTRFFSGGMNYSYDITINQTTVSPGATLTINGGQLTATETLRVNAAAESDGHLRLFGGAGKDVLVAGGGDDLIYGGLGGDRLEGGAGRDIYQYKAAAETTGVNFDQIVGFDVGTDLIDLPAAVTVSGPGARVTVGSLSAATFNTDLALAIDQALQPNGAVLFSASSGDMAGRIFAVVDADGDGAYAAGNDFVIEFVHPSEPIGLPIGLFV